MKINLLSVFKISATSKFLVLSLLILLLQKTSIKAQSCSPPVCGSECFSQIPVSEIPNLPIMTVEVDFHFVKSNGNNFQCTNPATNTYAPTYVQQILSTANEYFLNPDPNQFGSSPDLPDTRIRYRLYGNPNDPCDAIFFHDDDPTNTPSIFTNQNALHIVIFDNGSQGASGKQISNTVIQLFQIHQAVFELNSTNVSNWGGILNHELGHRFGLCHSFSLCNECPDMDPVAECGGPSATECEYSQGVFGPCPEVEPNSPYEYSLETCSGNTCLSCFCTWGTGNNFMGYNGSLRGMTLSQWEQMYGAIVSERPSFINLCIQQNSSTTDYFITEDTEWDYTRFLPEGVEDAYRCYTYHQM
jgi:hypothetical protein